MVLSNSRCISKPSCTESMSILIDQLFWGQMVWEHFSLEALLSNLVSSTKAYPEPRTCSLFSKYCEPMPIPHCRFYDLLLKLEGLEWEAKKEAKADKDGRNSDSSWWIFDGRQLCTHRLAASEDDQAVQTCHMLPDSYWRHMPYQTPRLPPSWCFSFSPRWRSDIPPLFAHLQQSSWIFVLSYSLSEGCADT